MISSLTFETLIKELEREQNELSSELVYRTSDKEKEQILKQLTAINGLMKTLINYLNKYIMVNKTESKKSKVKEEIKKIETQSNYNIKNLLK